jgi:hypothetical protein
MTTIKERVQNRPKDPVDTTFEMIKSEYNRLEKHIDSLVESSVPQMQVYTFYKFISGMASHLDNPEYHLMTPEQYIEKMTGKKVGRIESIKIKMLAAKMNAFTKTTQGVFFHPEKTKKDKKTGVYFNIQ